MMELKKADIMLIHLTHALSIGVQIITDSPYSHVILVSDPIQNEMIEADPLKGVICSDLRTYKGHGLVLRIENLTDEQRDQIVGFAKQQVGSPYDLDEAFKLFQRYGLKINPKADQDKSYICSTLVAAAYQSIGITLSKELVQSPDDIFKSDLLTIVGRY